MDSFFTDVRQAIRVLRKSPGFALAVIAVLALGIGANTAIFSLVSRVLLEPLPFADSSRLLAIRTLARGTADQSSYLDAADIGAQSTTIDAVAGYSGNAVTLTGSGDAATVPAAMVTGGFFKLLGVAPLRGRTVSGADDEHGAPLVAVISESMWSRRFDRDPSIVGRGITIDGQPFTVVGVMPAAFDFPFGSERVQAWLPTRSVKFMATLADQRGASFLTVIGHLRRGATLQQARTELGAIGARLAAQYPDTNRVRTFDAEPLKQTLVADYRVALLVLFGAVGVVLLIACANVANLLLARGTSRRKEMAVRTALGASRGRLARQLVTESVVLALIGGAAGVLLAIWGLTALVAASPIEIPRLHTVGVDRTVLLFAFVASIVTGIVFGSVPALQLSRTDPNEAIKDEGRGSSGARGGRTRSTIVAAEMALSLVLLVSAGLLVRSLLQLQHVNPGFAPEHVAGMLLTLPDAKYPTSESRTAFADRMLETVRAMPGVRQAAVTTTLPLSGDAISLGFSIDGRPRDPAGRLNAPYFSVTPEYFSTMGIPVVRGRAFDARDRRGARDVAIVNETMARQYWPGEDPVGKHLTLNLTDTGSREIVGVVADVKNRTLSDAPQAQLYAPLAQVSFPFMTPVVRSAGDAAMGVSALRSALAVVDPSQAPAELKTMDEYLAQTIATPRFTAIVTAGFAALAVLLAGIGLYGVMAYSVAERRREIGIRMALGAQPADVRQMIVGQALRLGAIGLAIGLVAAWGATRVIASLLFGVGAGDPLTFAAVTTLLAAVLLVAAYVPARRATAIDPVVALRAE